MGRPIKEKFFGNTNSPYTNVARGGTSGVGGEGFGAVAILNTATNSGYSTSTTVTWTGSTPQVPGGVAASGTANVQFIGGTGRIQSLNITTAGTGYTSTSSVTITFSPATGGTAATYAITALTSSRQNALRGFAYLTTGSSAVPYDIMEQRSSRRYLVNTSQGRGVVKLATTTTLTAGTMNLEATDANSNKYLVKKLTGRRAVLVRTTASGAWLFATNAAAGWTFNSASTGTVSLANN
jgi:hypothetical protein